MSNENLPISNTLSLTSRYFIPTLKISSPFTSNDWMVYFNSKFVILAATLFPGIGCYACIAYTYLFQFNKIVNFASDHCNGTMSYIPPVSYSIGVWKPQKFFWLSVLMLHVPPRIIYVDLCIKFFLRGPNASNSDNYYFHILLSIHRFLMHLEIWALVGVSIFDIEYNFLIHATFFGFWLASFNFNMLFSIILQYQSGINETVSKYYTLFKIRTFIYIVGCPISLTASASYIYYLKSCKDLAYVTFAITEYTTVGINSLFYLLSYIDADKMNLDIAVVPSVSGKSKNKMCAV
ncbi:Frag1/DRAM/Sfk1 family-containing protein [Strongyloides ratti]|uniref:Frag1/DRAM/Sfk1 family-containing protein n=1 Tax=Strongyloides ratti TaxID=34506 RepID=A0A090KPR2_STRRB|nr:Frag1/DRAM/Sfk1 family-containing protein [Strongyloides ratti]CEF59558.1 Frag1/DRAM/Sfk1 family-containing protein [Strongyloides ratti]